MASLASAGMPYSDRDVAIVMLTDVGMVLEHRVQRLHTELCAPRRSARRLSTASRPVAYSSNMRRAKGALL